MDIYVSDFEPKTKSPQQKAWDIAATVVDPEIPVLSIADLGILRDVEVAGDHVKVTITPTYSGCPAMDAIRDDVKTAFEKAGYTDVEVDLVLAPAWTTDWMTEEGKAKLQEYGIAPPTGHSKAARHAGPIRLSMAVKCPQCASLNTKELTRFGSTSCKALYVCQDCKEPFDYFKVL
ncbi:phenylacetate-CoA oxygenase subunit PaaJ [Pseudarthrobacter phenanthrenivorans]|uniref:Phenylacetate-CoA oxygenase subunit PaaJ n=1 Tax=Pseudarthrobacter phenanthrenivorans TaxID=361575 RepID=A0A3B0FP42_PSEPS|nr:1,2-phenylacetyl-CoA epoxidase subunit PaaD [Pseudarthrobacter phenanthrenivorans]RKO21635.1 phenylacetate-CoA oxygenase subunit PaaJ [Pseudarthrobacter phenanthrenivorans]TPV52721.1 phenylacetate-CoA oxygenase subunit PaaJ [Pseudarthrobacter phenanthrenivorans]